MTPGVLMIGLEGQVLTAEERDYLQHPRVQGVILFDRNLDSPEQLLALVADIHGCGSPAPLVAIDQEGGRVQRLGEPLTPLPPARVLGRMYDHTPDLAVERASQVAWLMAAELRAMGIDLSFAPVLDLDRGHSHVIGDRALHADPDVVAELGGAWVGGMREAGMVATGKHFPGHGGVTADSHTDLPVDDRPVLAVRGEDMVPFERLITEHGLDALMTAHIVFSDLDNQAVTFSEFWIHRVLRQELGFDGVVISDDLGMEAAASVGDYPARALSAVRAGCDLVMICNELDAVSPVLDAMGADVPDETQGRVARLYPGKNAPDLKTLRQSENWQAARSAIEQFAQG